MIIDSFVSNIKRDGIHHISDSMMWLEGCFGCKNMVIAFIYAPTEGYEKKDEIKFYNDVDMMVASFPKGSMLVLLGDWNARMREDGLGLR